MAEGPGCQVVNIVLEKIWSGNFSLKINMGEQDGEERFKSC